MADLSGGLGTVMTSESCSSARALSSVHTPDRDPRRFFALRFMIDVACRVLSLVVVAGRRRLSGLRGECVAGGGVGIKLIRFARFTCHAQRVVIAHICCRIRVAALVPLVDAGSRARYPHVGSSSNAKFVESLSRACARGDTSAPISVVCAPVVPSGAVSCRRAVMRGRSARAAQPYRAFDSIESPGFAQRGSGSALWLPRGGKKRTRERLDQAFGIGVGGRPGRIEDVGLANLRSALHIQREACGTVRGAIRDVHGRERMTANRSTLQAPTNPSTDRIRILTNLLLGGDYGLPAAYST